MNQQPIVPFGAPIHGNHDLPVHPPEQLFGRDADIATTHLALKAGGAVLLHGLSGIGKTALAAYLASSYAESRGGVLWLENTNDTLISLSNRVLRAYGIDTGVAVTPLQARLVRVRELLTTHRPMIVLDGKVRLDAAREFVRECAPGLPLLLTQTSMAPGPWTPHAISMFSQHDTRAMLVKLAGISVKTDAEALDELVDALRGHPLSVSIAGRQLATGVTPRDFLSRLPDLPAGATNHAMGVVMAGYRFLPSALQGLVLLLGSAFASGASEELLAEVGGAPVEVIRATLRQLVKMGLAAEETVYGQPYFVAHELIQAFATAFLRGKRQLDAMQGRHRRGLLTYLERYIEDNSVVSHDRLAAEMASVLAAGVAAAQNDESDYLAILVQLLEPVSGESFVRQRGFQQELEWLRYLMTHPEAVSAGLLAHLEEMAEPEPELTGRDLPGEAVSEPAGQLAPDAELVSESEIEAVSVGAVPESVTVSEEPLADEAAPAPSSEATTERGDTAQAIEQYTEALTAYQADGNIEDELAALEALAELNLEAENYEDVLAYVDRGMALAQESDNPLREGQLLVVLGDLQYIIGRLEGAETAYREAVTAFQPTASWDEIGLTLGKLGALYEEQGKLEDAITVWQQTVPIFERFNRDDELIDALNDLGDAHSRLMRWDDARAYYTQALEHIESLGDPEEIFDQVVLLATQLEASGNRHEATMYFQRALHLAFELGNQPRQGHVLLALARLMMDEGVLLNRVIQLLEAASERLPGNHAVQRLLRRAKTRQQRLTDAGITLILPEDSLEDYARAVVEWQSENIG